MPNMCVVNTSVPVSISASVNYRPQQSCGKVIFSQASVSHSVHRGVSTSVHAGIHPPGRYTPSPLGR